MPEREISLCLSNQNAVKVLYHMLRDISIAFAIAKDSESNHVISVVLPSKKKANEKIKCYSYAVTGTIKTWTYMMIFLLYLVTSLYISFKKFLI